MLVTSCLNEFYNSESGHKSLILTIGFALMERALYEFHSATIPVNFSVCLQSIEGFTMCFNGL